MKTSLSLIAYAVIAATFADISAGGITSGQQGFVTDQGILLDIVTDGLAVYNRTPDPLIASMSQLVTLETVRVPQAPLEFSRHADGGTPKNSRVVNRRLNTPLEDFDLSNAWTVTGLQDALEEDIMNTLNASLMGDAQLVEGLFWQTIFTPQTVGSVSTAYRASAYNGETDVPPYQNNSFTAAHYHYLGTNSADAVTPAAFDSAKLDVVEHGYGTSGPGGTSTLACFFNPGDENAFMDLIETASALGRFTTAMRERGTDRGLLNTGVMVRGVLMIASYWVPSGYFCIADTSIPILNRREHVTPAYRGLQLFQESFNEKFPLAGAKFLRRIGFSGRHLGAYTCRKIASDATWVTPTFRLSALN